MNARAVLLCRTFSLCLILWGASHQALAQSTVVKQNYPGLTITGTVGNTYPIEYVDVLVNGSNNWITLSNLVLPSSPYLFIDTSAPNLPHRFYRDTNSAMVARNVAGLNITGRV